MFVKELEDRFVRYVKIDTTSDEFSTTAPTTQKQFDLLNLLADELREMGAADVRVTDYGVTLATIPATAGGDIPTIALLGHVDTSPQFSGTDVKPIIHRNYDGKPIVLPDAPERVIDPAAFPYLAEKVGDDVVTASGTTLLGADDKAGVAIAMVTANYLLQHPEIPHGKIRLCFTPDEEVGRGVANLTQSDLEADFAYTLDGQFPGEVCYETFSADKATITITGVSIHPGYARGKMVNAVQLAGKLIDRFPQDARSPWTTAGREGYVYIYKMEGSTAEATLHVLLRDYELDGLAEHAAVVEQLCAELQAEEPRAKIECKIEQQYRNMRYWLENDMRPVEYAQAAVRAAGLPLKTRVARGGTDGSRLTEMGIPTPDIFTGMQNYHGPLEWVSLQDMEQSVRVCIELVQQWVDA